MRRERRAWGYGGILTKGERATATASATVEQGGRLRLQRGWCIAVRQRVQARGRRRGAGVEERPDSEAGDRGLCGREGAEGSEAGFDTCGTCKEVSGRKGHRCGAHFDARWRSVQGKGTGKGEPARGLCDCAGRRDVLRIAAGFKRSLKDNTKLNGLFGDVPESPRFFWLEIMNRATAKLVLCELLQPVWSLIDCGSYQCKGTGQMFARSRAQLGLAERRNRETRDCLGRRNTPVLCRDWFGRSISGGSRGPERRRFPKWN